MLIFAIDDERPILSDIERIIAEAAPNAEIRAFSSAEDALSAIKEQNLSPDILFCDIEMPGLSGLEFALEIKTALPGARVVFVTGYSEYALEAFKARAHGYIMKPLTAELVRAELEYQLPKPEPDPEKLTVQCFGHFEVFYKGRPVIFARRQAKELFAYLVDRNGAAATAEEICTALWEDENDMVAEKTRLRRLISDLKSALHDIGMDDVLIRERRQLAVRRDRLDCDYYRMLDGDMAAVNSYRGEYMVDYSWAELTAGALQFGKW